jgi:mRNA-degrading endonuclease YafQ of YafQ-DinJ toxin-antitoxin module
MTYMDPKADTSRTFMGHLKFSGWKDNTSKERSDFLSSYLFNITMDVLDVWIQKLNENHILKTIYAGCRSCLLYADDTLIFIKPIAQQLNILKLLLDIFGSISRLNVNM